MSSVASAEPKTRSASAPAASAPVGGETITVMAVSFRPASRHRPGRVPRRVAAGSRTGGAGSRTASPDARLPRAVTCAFGIVDDSVPSSSHPGARRPRPRPSTARRSRCPRTLARVSCWPGWRCIPGAHGRQRLAGLLRPDVAEESARKTLRDAVYELRRALAPAEPVVATREAVELRAEVDLARVPVAARTRATSKRRCGSRGGELLAGLDADWALRARDEHACRRRRRAGRAGRAGAERRGAPRSRWTRAPDRARAAGRGGAPRPDPPAGAGRRPARGARRGRRARRPAAARAAHPAVGGDAGAGRGGPARARRRRRGLGPAAAARRRSPAPPGRGPRGAAAAPARRRGTTPARGRCGSRSRPASPGSARRRCSASSRGACTPRAPRSCSGAATSSGLLPYQPWVEALERHLVGAAAGRARAAARRRRARAAAAVARARRRAGRRRRRALPRVRGGARAARGDGRRAPGRCSSSTTCTGPTPTRCTCCATSRGWRTARACWSRSRCAEAELTPAAAATLADLRREGPLVQLALAGSTRTRSRPCSPATARPGDAAAYRERTGGNPFFLDELLRDEAERGDGGAPPPGVREVIGRRVARLPAARAPRPAGGRGAGPGVRAAGAADRRARAGRRSTPRSAAGLSPRSASGRLRVRARAGRRDAARRRCRPRGAPACTCGSPTRSPARGRPRSGRDRQARPRGGTARAAERRVARGSWPRRARRRRCSPTPTRPRTTRPRWPRWRAGGRRVRERGRAAPRVATRGRAGAATARGDPARARGRARPGRLRGQAAGGVRARSSSSRATRATRCCWRGPRSATAASACSSRRPTPPSPDRSSRRSHRAAQARAGARRAAAGAARDRALLPRPRRRRGAERAGGRGRARVRRPRRAGRRPQRPPRRAAGRRS